MRNGKLDRRTQARSPSNATSDLDWRPAGSGLLKLCGSHLRDTNRSAMAQIGHDRNNNLREDA